MKTYIFGKSRLSKDDASNIHPLDIHTKFVIKINLLALEHMAHKRNYNRVYKEFRSESLKISLKSCKILGYYPGTKEALKTIKYR